MERPASADERLNLLNEKLNLLTEKVAAGFERVESNFERVDRDIRELRAASIRPPPKQGWSTRAQSD